MFPFLVTCSIKSNKILKLYNLNIIDNVIDVITDSVLIIDRNNKINNVNNSTLNLLGYNKNEIMDTSLKDIVNLTNFKSNFLSKISAGDMFKNIVTEFITKEKKMIPMNISTFRLYNDNKGFEGAFIVARSLTKTKKTIIPLEETKSNLKEKLKEKTTDLENVKTQLQTEKKKCKTNVEKIRKLQEKIELQNIQLEKLGLVKSEFLNVSSHELRTPITSIKGYTQILLKQNLGKINIEQERALGVILRNTDRLDNLIQDILDISLLETDNMKFLYEITNIKNMIEDLVETLQRDADHKGIKINLEISKRIPDLVMDQERISQVVRNLVDNAIKFSSYHTNININICISKNRNDFLFEVQDFGCGIPKDKQRRIFDVFYQVDSGFDRRFGGVGLGLAISRGIVISHGGRIWVESKVGKGSIFRFTIPLKHV
jgi:PAS domain S-box-containing protein